MKTALPFGATAAAFAAVLALAGCAATPAVDAQWSDPQLAGNPLRGSRVYVVCESTEVVLSRICVDRLSAELQARGASVVTPPATGAATPPQPRDDSRYLAAARAAGARAVLAASVGPEPFASEARSGSGVSLGLGGFSFGRSGGVGVGVSLPMGEGAPPAPRYSADARVTETASGRLLWTARAGSPPSGDARSQIDNLVQRLVGAAQAKLF